MTHWSEHASPHIKDGKHEEDHGPMPSNVIGWKSLGVDSELGAKIIQALKWDNKITFLLLL